MVDSFPRQYARTQRLTLGEPRDLNVTPDGKRVVFARSRGGADPVNCLWVVDVESGEERLVADPVVLMADVAADDADLPPEERARRERLREGAGGITGYDLDRAAERAVFVLAGNLFVADLDGGCTRLDVPGPVFDPHVSPDGTKVAYVRGRELWVADLAGDARLVARPDVDDADTVSWGSADFVAAEEMNRYRGFWWSPDSASIAACRVDDAPVHVWHISNPADPGATPNAVRYPAAGTPNPVVTLWVCPLGSADRTEVVWDRAAFEYLAKVSWNGHGLALTVLSRDQHDLRVLVADPSTGTTSTVFTEHDDAWVELVPGTGSLLAPGTPVMCTEADGARRLALGDEIVSPADVQIRSVVHAEHERIIVTGNPLDDASQLHVYRWTHSGGFEALTDGLAVHQAAIGGDTVLFRTATVDEPGARWRLPNGDTLASHAERPLVRPNVRITAHTADVPTTAVLLPHDHDGSPLPVLLDPYGGPHAQRVLRSHNAFCASQWFADQGFAVVVADGRGTPGRGTAYERSVFLDLATGVLDDQVTALHAAAEQHPELDLTRVAVRGWSFGGYLSALAVMKRPDVFHAAVAGAPVTEWRLYDTCYTERYLGDPNERPDVYDANSLLPLAPELSRPLLLIHGLADDNVVAAHTLQLSSALLAAGKPHEVLPLVGVTHMTPQEIVAENLLLHQLDFLRRSLGG
ncbi:MAG: S9 family peptidase [Ilumatobacter sp.]|nr:S9 family peptidase [Ilumatobacter sp.]